MNVSLEDDNPNPSEYQLVIDGDEPEMDIPNLIYPFTIIMSTCTISAAAYISLSKKRKAKSVYFELVYGKSSKKKCDKCHNLGVYPSVHLRGKLEGYT